MRAGVAESPQPEHEERVVLERGVVADDGIEHLELPGGREVEGLADGGLLGAGVLPPGALEVEDGHVVVGQLHGRGPWGSGPTAVGSHPQGCPSFSAVGGVGWSS